ncbi:MAG: pyrroline-5-carboxylate reductase [Spirochaetaceae bacterium 4572_59]|nr:MAG: pyrroline-5-carboxylate reductase [Spirochaetaceae bacterium 4572_59]
MNIGFIGSGNMASAIMGGLINATLVKEDCLYVTDASEDALVNIINQFPGVHTSQDNLEFLSDLDFLFLAVKPHIYAPVIAQIKKQLPDNVIVITIAAGQTRERVLSQFGRKIKLVRTMPNTPALVGEGMTAVCAGEKLSEEEIIQTLTLLKAVGKVEILPESLFDSYTALCGSGPAYVYMFIEALADGAVREGIPRDKAYRMAAQTVLGSARMVLETGEHPGVLKDQVCSPGGTTIEAVGSLEENGFRSSVMQAIRVCTEKSVKMSKE